MTVIAAVADLDRAVFDRAALIAADQLREHGLVVLDFQPGDGTRYEIVIVSGRHLRYQVTTDETLRIFGRSPSLVRLANCGGGEARWEPGLGGDEAEACVERMGMKSEWTQSVVERLLTSIDERLGGLL